MSKYQSLVDHLNASRGDRVPMRFEEVEKALGSRLPGSARRHPAWWANTGGSHVHAAAWMRSGWRTCGVDLVRERVTFVKQNGATPGGMTSHPPMGDGNEGLRSASSTETVINRSELNLAVRQLLDRIQQDEGVDFKGAVLEALNWSVRDSRRRLFEDFRARSTGPTSDSVDLIREDRDAR